MKFLSFVLVLFVCSVWSDSVHGTNIEHAKHDVVKSAQCADVDVSEEVRQIDDIVSKESSEKRKPEVFVKAVAQAVVTALKTATNCSDCKKVKKSGDVCSSCLSKIKNKFMLLMPCFDFEKITKKVAGNAMYRECKTNEKLQLLTKYVIQKLCDTYMGNFLACKSPKVKILECVAGKDSTNVTCEVNSSDSKTISMNLLITVDQGSKYRISGVEVDSVDILELLKVFLTTEYENKGIEFLSL